MSTRDISEKVKSSNDLENIVSDFSRFYILVILYEGPAHGYSIISKFRKRIGKKVSPSLVYPFLKQLMQKGFVKCTSKPIGAKTRKVFELTDRGMELCKRLFKRFSALVSVALEESLKVCANCGCKLYEGGYRELIDGKMLTFCCVHCAQSYKREHGILSAT